MKLIFAAATQTLLRVHELLPHHEFTFVFQWWRCHWLLGIPVCFFAKFNIYVFKSCGMEVSLSIDILYSWQTNQTHNFKCICRRKTSFLLTVMFINQLWEKWRERTLIKLWPPKHSKEPCLNFSCLKIYQYFLVMAWHTSSPHVISD